MAKSGSSAYHAHMTIGDGPNRFPAKHTTPSWVAPNAPVVQLDRMPDDAFRFIALDVETSCNDMASICQIGIACVGIGNRIQTFSMLIDPEKRFARFNINLHGIGPDTVAGAPTFPEAWALFFPLLRKHALVQHSHFDACAIAAVCDAYGLPAPDLSWNNSVTVAKRAWPELKGNGGYGLASLKKHLDLKFRHHDAEEDARAAALVVLHAEAHLNRKLAQLSRARPNLQRALPL